MGKKIVFLFVVIIFIVSCRAQNSIINKSVVNKLDIERYLGTWYEISRYDHKFERGLVGVTANYSLRQDGKLKVVNSGYKNSLRGEYSEAVGKAKIPNLVSEPAKLKVSFFWIFYGDYFVMELDENYQWAVIGSSSDKYLWVLSRTPQMGKSIYDELLNRLSNRGYDVSKLLEVEQKLN